MRKLVYALVATVGVSQAGGCALSRLIPDGKHDTKRSYHDNHGLRIEYPEVRECATKPRMMAQQTVEPLAMQDPSQLPVLELSLQEAINMAVTQSPVLRTTGATTDVRVAAQGVATIYDPALTAASPVLGAEAALSAFDAQWTSQLFWATVDRPNNVKQGGVTSVFTPNVSEATNANFNAGVAKTTATGATFSMQHIVNYTRNNQPFRAFSSAFDGWLQAEWRQPLAQGYGSTYNRIAGPNALPGQYNGVLIARVNEDVSLADFENSVIQLVNDVEQDYWELVTAYRTLDTAVRGRELARRTWDYNKKRLDVGSGRVDDEAQARSQYYEFEAQVQAALAGINGLYKTEQDLRYLVGLPATDGRLIRPTTEPVDTRVTYDWDSALGQALERRVEIRRQRLQVERRDMELVAARLNYKPRLDFLGQYRWYGLGNHLIGDNTGVLDNMYAEITGGNYQEWQAGLDLSFPVGLRTAGVAIAHAKLNVRRERAVLAETEFLISHDLSDAARQIEITHQLLETNYDRLLADLNQVDVLDARYRVGADNIRDLLLAQRQLVASATDFYRSLSEYNLAIRDFHKEKGSLLAYNYVQLSEGPWANGAAYDAYQVGRFLTPRINPEATFVPTPLTTGPFDPAAVQDTSMGLGDAPIAVESIPVPDENAQPMKDLSNDVESGAVQPLPDAATSSGRNIPPPPAARSPVAQPPVPPAPPAPGSPQGLPQLPVPDANP
ncbi:MAG: TolC family protein [Rubripirellula sp.]